MSSVMVNPLTYLRVWAGYQVNTLASRLALKSADYVGDRLAALGQQFDNPQWANLVKYSNQAAAYSSNSWVYIAVRLKSEAVALTSLNVFTLQNEKKTAVVNHAFEQLLRNPNKRHTGFELIENTVGSLELTGNAYWYLNGAPGIPTEILPMRSDRVRIVGGNTTDDFIRGYVYEIGGTKVPIDADMVVHFWLYDPASDYYGLSRLEAAALAYQTDKNMQRFNANFFSKGNTHPSGVVNIKSNISNEKYDQIKRDWTQTYGGSNQETAFIRGADISYQTMQLSQKDMDFLAGRQFSKEEIFMIFGVYPGMLDKNATEANANAAGDGFTQYTQWPLEVRIAQRITKNIMPLYGDDLICEAEDIRRKDAAAQRLEIETAKQFMSGNEIRQKYYNLEPATWADLNDPRFDGQYLTINEMRKLYYNLPSRPDGDLYASGAGAAAITGQPAKPGAIPAQVRQIPGDTQTRQIEQNAENAGKGITIEMPEPLALPSGDVPRIYESRKMREEREQFARFATKGKDINGFKFSSAPTGYVIAVKALADAGNYDLLTFKADDKTASKWERKLQTAIQGYFDGLTTRLVAGVRHVNNPNTGKALPDLARFLGYFTAAYWRNELDILSSILSPLMQDAVDTFAVDAANTLTMTTGIAVDDSVFISRAAEWAKTYTDSVLAGFNTTTQDGIGAILSRYIDTPDATLTDLITAIQESRLVGSDRANIVAVTELTRAQGNGEYLAGVELADESGVQVLVSQTDIDYYFPGHPYCKCRLIAEFQYDENDQLVGIDYRWSYIADNAARECEICAPRNGLLMSEIAGAA